MTQTAWAHLPNAKHIDWVIASVKAHPKKWVAAWGVKRDAAWAAARDAAKGVKRDAAWYAAKEVAGDNVWNAADDAIIALIAYDDCAYMIESEVGELKIIAAFGDQRAMLLLPACIVFNKTKEEI